MKAITARLFGRLAPFPGLAVKLIGRPDRLAGVAVVLQNRAAKAVKLGFGRRHEIHGISRRVVDHCSSYICLCRGPAYRVKRSRPRRQWAAASMDRIRLVESALGPASGSIPPSN